VVEAGRHRWVDVERARDEVGRRAARLMAAVEA